jgi:hypothetical protein
MARVDHDPADATVDNLAAPPKTAHAQARFSLIATAARPTT